MGFARKLIKVELICLIIDKSKHYYEKDYINILVTEYNNLPIIFLQEEDFCIDNLVKALYNKYIGVDFEWASKYLADVSVKDNSILIRYVVKLPKINNMLKAGKLITPYSFLENVEDKTYDRIISG